VAGAFAAGVSPEEPPSSSPRPSAARRSRLRFSKCSGISVTLGLSSFESQGSGLSGVPRSGPRVGLAHGRGLIGRAGEIATTIDGGTGQTEFRRQVAPHPCPGAVETPPVIGSVVGPRARRRPPDHAPITMHLCTNPGRARHCRITAVGPRRWHLARMPRSGPGRLQCEHEGSCRRSRASSARSTALVCARGPVPIHTNRNRRPTRPATPDPRLERHDERR
jgi:hypothetical protein